MESFVKFPKALSKKIYNGKYHEKAFTTTIRTERNSLLKMVLVIVVFLPILLQLITSILLCYRNKISVNTILIYTKCPKSGTVYVLNKAYK